MSAAPPDSSDLTTRKAAARKAAFAARKTAFAAHQSAPQQAVARFVAAVDVPPDAVVSGYRPIRTELDPTPLMTVLHDRGVRMCVPVVIGRGRPLAFSDLDSGAPMTPGAFGADIPVDPTEVEPTLLITPLLAFDRRLYRLGYGGGFYDRTLEALRAARPTQAVGYAYANQEIPTTPIDSTDQRLNGVVTEQEAIV